MTYFTFEGKRIFYQETGSGKPVMLLHGNTASSKMFEPLLQLYESRFRVICMDFLGHGRSDRLEAFPASLWMEEARQTIGLLEHLNYQKVSLIGTSGGAYVALNAALERPDLVDKVVADSLDGCTLGETFAQDLLAERAAAKAEERGRWFYRWCQGEDWESVVDCDTAALIECAEKKLPLFQKPLKELRKPLLLIGSKGDRMLRRDFLEEYKEMARDTGGEVVMFEEGDHPAILSNAEQAAAVITRFLEKE